MGGHTSRFWARSPVQASIILTGLDASGKSTVLYKLDIGKIASTIPTIGVVVEQAKANNIEITSFIAGGRSRVRPLFRHYYPGVNAMIFVVNSADRERMEEADRELKYLIGEEGLRGALLLVLANMQDVKGAMTADEVSQQLNLQSISGRSWNIFPCSGKTGQGMQEAMSWLQRAIEASVGVAATASPNKA